MFGWSKRRTSGMRKWECNTTTIFEVQITQHAVTSSLAEHERNVDQKHLPTMSKDSRGQEIHGPCNVARPSGLYTYASERFPSLFYQPTRLLDGNLRGPRKGTRVGIPPNGLSALLPRRPTLGTRGRHCVREIDARVRVESSERGSEDPVPARQRARRSRHFRFPVRMVEL